MEQVGTALAGGGLAGGVIAFLGFMLWRVIDRFATSSDKTADANLKLATAIAELRATILAQRE